MQLNELFETNPQEFDTRLAEAAETLEKVAQQEGFDLNLLDDTEKAAMLREIMGEQAQVETPPPVVEPAPAAKVASAAPETTTPEEAPGLTVVEVSLEMNKRASAEGLDLSTLTPEQYEETFNKVAEDMLAERDPEVQEQRAKLAEAEAYFDHMGRVCARAFDDECEKIAAAKEAAAKQASEEGKEETKEKREGEENKFPPADKNREAKDDDKGETKEAMMGKLLGAAKGLAAKSPVLAGAAAGGAVGGAAGAAMSKKASKEEIEAEAQKVARQFLIEEGYNPDTGEKIAQSHEDLVRARAVEILTEQGYVVK